MSEQDLLKNFAAALRARRVQRKLTQMQLAKAGQVSYKTLSNIENARNWPSIPVYHRMCAALACKLPPLFSSPVHRSLVTAGTEP